MRLIDTDALAKFIDFGKLHDPNEKFFSENDIREMIDMMPTIDAEPVRHGAWIKENDYWRCSKCGEIHTNNMGIHPFAYGEMYCPNCGAKMDGDAE